MADCPAALNSAGSAALNERRVVRLDLSRGQGGRVDGHVGYRPVEVVAVRLGDALAVTFRVEVPVVEVVAALAASQATNLEIAAQLPRPSGGAMAARSATSSTTQPPCGID
jgi:hypothetical protein